MVVKEYFTTRKDGVKLFKSYSDANKYIRKVGTEEVYAEAIDVESATYTYEETKEDLLVLEEETSEMSLRGPAL